MENIINIRHPFYADNLFSWQKWRRTYRGGEEFIAHYLRQFSRGEANDDFLLRKQITYCPAFAKAGVNEVKNSIFQRFVDITRLGGSKYYQDAVDGRNGGVDKSGNSMSSFMGRKVLPELLPMARVGIYIDMPRINGLSIADRGDARPYIYLYETEQIRAWSYDPEQTDRLLSVLLEDYSYNIDQMTGLTTGLVCTYRHCWINEDGFVQIKKYDKDGMPDEEEFVLGIRVIPLHILEISDSLLRDIDQYQVALLNLESSDLFYALKSNFPFYTEQFNPKSESLYLKQPGDSVEIVRTERNSSNSGNITNNKTIVEGTSQQVTVGAAAGRRYPAGLERPAFISPSSEPLKISMEKAEQLKRDIKLLINLNIQNLAPRRASAESKTIDDRSLENGLSYIGLELEYAERRIAEIWAMYEGITNSVTVNYPKSYTLRNETERRDEAKYFQELTPKIASETFQKETSKRVVDLTIGCYVSYDTLQTIKKEIDDADVIVSDPDIIDLDIKNGLVSAKLASEIRGYPDGEVEIAAKEHADKLARIAISQSQGIGAATARGVPQLGGDPKAGQEEKQLAQNNSYDATPKDKIRGEGK